MDKFIIVGETDAKELLVINTSNDTVTRIPAASLHADVQAMLGNGTVVTKGVSVAAVVSSLDEAVGRFFHSND